MMIVRKLRLRRGWSQDQLAQMSGLSVRTIQRLERGHNAGLESLKSLAAVFEIDFNELQSESAMSMNNPSSQATESPEPDSRAGVWSEERDAIRYVRDIKGFYVHLAIYVVLMPALIVFNYVWDSGYIWAWWTALGWGLGVVSHGLNVFEVINLFSPGWERRQIEKRLGRKL